MGEGGRKDKESGRRGVRNKSEGGGARGRGEGAGRAGGKEGNKTVLTLYSIMNPRSSDLCIFVTCFANCSTGMGGWSASLITSPGAASSFFLAPETQARRC